MTTHDEAIAKIEEIRRIVERNEAFGPVQDAFGALVVVLFAWGWASMSLTLSGLALGVGVICAIRMAIFTHWLKRRDKVTR